MDLERLTEDQRRENARKAIERAKEAIARETNTHPSNWMTGREACDFLGISSPTLISGRKAGKYRYVHHNASRVYYDKRSLEEHITPRD